MQLNRPGANLRAIGRGDYNYEIRRPNGWPANPAAELSGFCRGLFSKLLYHNDLRLRRREPATAPLLARPLPFVRPHNRRINGFGRADFRRRSRATYRPQRLPGPCSRAPRRLPPNDLQPNPRRPSADGADHRGLAAGADRLGRRRIRATKSVPVVLRRTVES